MPIHTRFELKSRLLKRPRIWVRPQFFPIIIQEATNSKLTYEQRHINAVLIPQTEYKIGFDPAGFP